MLIAEYIVTAIFSLAVLITGLLQLPFLVIMILIGYTFYQMRQSIKWEARCKAQLKAEEDRELRRLRFGQSSI